MPLTGPSQSSPRHDLGKRRIAVSVAMIALTDFLFFGHAPGLNLFVFSLAVTIAILAATARPLKPITAAAYMGISVVASVPLLESPTRSGVIVSMAVVILISLANARLLPRRYTAIPMVFLRFLPIIFIRLAETGRRRFVAHSGRKIFGIALGSAAGWLLPLGLGLVFLLLFSMANPVIAMGLANIDLHFLLQFLDPARLCLWLIAAIFIWALLAPRLARRRRQRHLSRENHMHGQVEGFFDHRSMVRCLWVFNLLFALQTGLDLLYLWGGADLPAGMSHAQYAHRGAYPLVATALLAAVFVLVSMRRGGPGDHSRLIRTLVIAWIMQNVLLCLSAILRLDLYIQSYSLTGWRIAAGVWMGLVAAGLVFILLRIALRRSNAWLISMNLMTLATVLYITACVDVYAFIARYNVENSMDIGQQGAPLDLQYLGSLGPSVIPALDQYLASIPADRIERRLAFRIRERLTFEFRERSDDWRSWSYRQSRMADYLRSSPLIER